jgi:DUF4097 and DUF4098 domain-containing protein YvlB
VGFYLGRMCDPPLNKTFTTSPGRDLTVAVKAGYLELEVIAGDTDRPAAEVSGPEKTVSAVTEHRSGNTWSLTWPADAGSGRGTTIISGGNMMFTSVIGGRIAGRVMVDGVDITDMINKARGGDSGPVRAVLRVPAGTVLDAEVDTGSIVTHGTLAGVRARTMSADVTCEGPVGQIEASTQSGDVKAEDTGAVQAATMSGDIRLSGAAGAVSARTMSGDISVHAADSIRVTADSMSGDVRVTAAPGARPSVSGRSMSGRVRTP